MQAEFFDIGSFIEEFIQCDAVVLDEIGKRQGFQGGLIEGIDTQL